MARSWQTCLEELKQGGTEFVLGHRGARHAAPENTLRAFELAREEGADGTELDVRLSKDGVPFVIHDRDLRRVTSGRETRLIEKLTAAQLKRVRLDGDESLPTLDEALDWAEAHDMLLNVELKTEKAWADPIAPIVADSLRSRLDPQRWLLVSSFHPLLLRSFHLALPAIPTAFLVTAAHGRWLSKAMLKLLGCSAVHPQASWLLENDQHIARLDGFGVNTWTVNDGDHARALRAQGVGGLISDNPAALLAALRRG
jgi:glycerophosphoryl diester phosphodiesterase